MSKQQTAVEWLFKEICKYHILQPMLLKNVIEQAKEMEKEQHGNTWLDSTLQFDNSAEMTYKKDFEQYYNEKFEP